MKHLKLPSVLYYVTRIAQRLSLLGFGLATIIYWVIHIRIYSETLIRFEQVAPPAFKDQERMNELANGIVNGAANGIWKWFFMASLLTLALLMFKRVRKYEKRLIVDSAVIITFCLVSAAFIQPIIDAFMRVYA